MSEGNGNEAVSGSSAAGNPDVIVGDEKHGDVAKVDIVFGEPEPKVVVPETGAAPDAGYRSLTPEQLDGLAKELEAKSSFAAKESPRRAAWRSIIRATSNYWITSHPKEYTPVSDTANIPGIISAIAPYVKLDVRTTILPGTLQPWKCSISYRLDALPDEAKLEVVRAIDPNLEHKVQALFGKDFAHELDMLYDGTEDARQSAVAKLARGTGLDELFRATSSIKNMVESWNTMVFPNLNSLAALMDENVGQAFAKYMQWCDNQPRCVQFLNLPPTDKQPTTLRLSPEALVQAEEAKQQTPPERPLPISYGILVIDSDYIYTMKHDGSKTYAELLPELPFIDYAALPSPETLFNKGTRGGENALVKYIQQNPAEREGVLEAVGNYNFLRQRIGNREHIAPAVVTESDAKGSSTVGPNKKRVEDSRFVNARFNQAKFVFDSLVDQYRPKPDY